MSRTQQRLFDRTVYFLHIPKTAGTTFTAILHQEFSASTVCPAYLWHELLRITPAQLGAYRLFRGHFYAYLDRVVKQPLQYITFLRNPIDRSVSHYAHITRSPEHYFYRRARQQGSVLAFLRDPVTNPLIINFQTRALALRLDPIAIAATLSRDALDALELERILETTMPTASDDELLHQAKKQLDQCLVVGLAERFDESVAYLRHQLQCANIPSQMYLNRAPEQVHLHNLDPVTQKVLHEQTHLDHELYAYASGRFEEQMKEIT